ncbi:MAG: TonB family protein [Limisphaerales bacterium]
MTRLLKKCIFLSIGLHVLVAALLIAVAAFFITKPEKVAPTLSMIAPEVLDNLLNPQSAPVQPRVTPTPPQPPVQRNRVPEPPTPRPPKKVAPVPTPAPPKKVTPIKKTTPPKSTPAKKRPPIKINASTKTVNGGGSTSRSPVAPPIRPSVNTEGLGKTVKNLRTQLSAGIKVNVSGANAAAFTSYAQYVVSVYRRTWEPLIPKTLARSRVAVVSVTVDRTGKVISARVVRKTGDAALDRSVQSALDRVRSIGKPFPSGSNDSKRTFTLDFTPRIQG